MARLSGNITIGRLFISWLWWDREWAVGNNAKAIYITLGPLMIAWDK